MNFSRTLGGTPVSSRPHRSPRHRKPSLDVAVGDDGDKRKERSRGTLQ
jgi:hypothetical protein